MSRKAYAPCCYGRKHLLFFVNTRKCSTFGITSEHKKEALLFRNHKITQNWPHTTILNSSIQTTVKSPIHQICFNSVFIYSVLLSFARLGTESGQGKKSGWCWAIKVLSIIRKPLGRLPALSQMVVIVDPGNVHGNGIRIRSSRSSWVTLQAAWNIRAPIGVGDPTLIHLQ